MKIHILGPTSSGTSTLGKAIAEKYKIPCFDSDDIIWVKSDPPFTQTRERDERIKILEDILKNNESFVLSGAVRSWGDFIGPFLDVVIYKYVDQETRIKRLIERETIRFGDRILPGNDMYENYIKLIEYTEKYETGGMEIRSKKSHLFWINNLKCKVFTIDGNYTQEDELKIAVEKIGL